jgi:hypothetical protein
MSSTSCRPRPRIPGGRGRRGGRSTPTPGVRPLHGRARDLECSSRNRRTDRREAGRRRLANGTGRRRGGRLGALSEYHRAQEDLAQVADLHRKIGALWRKGRRRASIDNFQRGIDLLKDGPPCISSLSAGSRLPLHAHGRQHACDLCLGPAASPSAWTGEAASQAHGIFGASSAASAFGEGAGEPGRCCPRPRIGSRRGGPGPAHAGLSPGGLEAD